MSISFEYNLIHVHIPKNAGSTINNMTPVNTYPSFPHCENICCCSKHLHNGASLLYRNYIGERNWDNFNSFALLRNPWDRLVSGWKFLIPELTFESFVHDLDNLSIHHGILWHVITTQRQHVTDKSNKIIIKKIGKVEELDKFMAELSQEWNFPLTDSYRRNATHHKHYTNYYNDELIDIVADRFKQDIALGNYIYGE